MKKLLTSSICALSLALSSLIPAFATELPAGVLNYVREKDPHVKVRFDGMVLFSNGETYVPVMPQDPMATPEPEKVLSSIPLNNPYPDLVEFNNHFFLIRLVQTASGRLTFPKMAEYPLQLKEGMLPQDFVIPPNLFIPVELKVILGALPYQPNFEAVDSTPASLSLGQLTGVHSRLAYVYDLNSQKVVSIDPILGHKQTEVALDCIPSSLQLTPDNKLLFAPCLSTNELVVIDPISNLIKTRVPVGQRPDHLLYLDGLNAMVVSNRYSPFLSIVNTNELLTAEKLMLPDPKALKPESMSPGAMSAVPGDPVHIVVADAFKPVIYWVNLNTRTVEKRIKALSDISAITVTLDEQGQPQIWAASRTENKVALLQPSGTEPIAKFDVGAKPVDMAIYGTRLFVLSAGKSQVDIIDWVKRSVETPIALTSDSFPASMTVVAGEHKAYIVMAGNTEIAIIDLETAQLGSTLPVDFRANMITSTPDPKEEAKQANIIAKTTLTPTQPTSVKLFIGPEEPELPVAEDSLDKSKHNKKKKSSPQSVSGPVETVNVDENRPKVMPVLRNDNYSLNNSRPLQLPLSRPKNKKPNLEPSSEGLPVTQPQPLPIMETTH